MAPGNIRDDFGPADEPREEDIAMDEEMDARREYFEEVRNAMDEAEYEEEYEEVRREEEDETPAYDSYSDPWAAQDEARFREEDVWEES